MKAKNTGKPKPAAPLPPEPDRQPGYGAELAEIITAEIDRVGPHKNVVFDAVMAHIIGNEEQFRRLGKAVLHRTCRKRIKKALHRLAVAAESKT
jgi:hypothetical protein